VGMYDIFEAEVECPHCGEKYEFSFQTKEFLKMLSNFDIGDDVVFEMRGRKFSLEEDKTVVKGHGAHLEHHDGCGESVYCDIVILSGEFARVENIRQEREKGE